MAKHGKSKEWYEAVIREYARMLVKNPRSRVFVSMADTCLRAGRTKMALDVVNKGLRRHPLLTAAHVQKGRALMALGRPEEAKQSLGYAIRSNPQNVLARKLLARLYLETAEPARGMEMLDEIRRMWPDHEPAAKLYEELRGAIENGMNGKDSRGEREPSDDSRPEALGTLERWLGNANKMMVKG